MNDDRSVFLSGDYDSLETTENQDKVIDILKLLGKISLIVSESSAKYRIEKVGGLDNYLYQQKKATDEDPRKVTREFLEQLEKEVRYEEGEQKIGNKTEMLRILMASMHGNKVFQEYMNAMIDESLDLTRKRSDNRHFAEKSQAEDIGN